MYSSWSQSFENFREKIQFQRGNVLIHFGQMSSLTDSTGIWSSLDHSSIPHRLRYYTRSGDCFTSGLC